MVIRERLSAPSWKTLKKEEVRARASKTDGAQKQQVARHTPEYPAKRAVVACANLLYNLIHAPAIELSVRQHLLCIDGSSSSQHL